MHTNLQYYNSIICIQSTPALQKPTFSYTGFHNMNIAHKMLISHDIHKKTRHHYMYFKESVSTLTYLFWRACPPSDQCSRWPFATEFSSTRIYCIRKRLALILQPTMWQEFISSFPRQCKLHHTHLPFTQTRKITYYIQRSIFTLLSPKLST